MELLRCAPQMVGRLYKNILDGTTPLLNWENLGDFFLFFFSSCDRFIKPKWGGVDGGPEVK